MTGKLIEFGSARSPGDPETERRARLRQLGIYLPPTLEEARKAQAAQSYLVEGLLRTGSVNLLVGDSGLGKTPLGIQLGVLSPVASLFSG
jgi:hypothetical protein